MVIAKEGGAVFDAPLLPVVQVIFVLVRAVIAHATPSMRTETCPTSVPKPVPLI